jgi:hypothetical protein
MYGLPYFGPYGDPIVRSHIRLEESTAPVGNIVFLVAQILVIAVRRLLKEPGDSTDTTQTSCEARTPAASLDIQHITWRLRARTDNLANAYVAQLLSLPFRFRFDGNDNTVAAELFHMMSSRIIDCFQAMHFITKR